MNNFPDVLRLLNTGPVYMKLDLTDKTNYKLLSFPYYAEYLENLCIFQSIVVWLP